MDLSELSDDDLWLQMQDDLYEGKIAEVVAETVEALGRGYSPQEVLASGLVAGMDVVGADVRDGILTVAGVQTAADAMKAGIEALRPLLAERGAERIGTVVIGTVKGDTHDIGKNLVAMMLEGAGFAVVDLGVDAGAQQFVEAVRVHQPEIVAVSALCTATMPAMGLVIEALRAAGLRERLFVMVGGAHVSESFAQQVGADAYGRDAAAAVDLARAYMARRREGAALPGVALGQRPPRP